MDPEFLIWDHTNATAAQQTAIRDAIGLWRGGGQGVADAVNGAGFPAFPPGFQFNAGAPNLPAAAPLAMASMPGGIFTPLAAPTVPAAANGLGNIYQMPTFNDAHQLLVHISATVHGVHWFRIPSGIAATVYPL